ncbi:uncharacterized protein B0I36DRAFT_3086 [Microdochium trichocladiopsis]|uniref:Bacteriophage T5 Orf172 DNA-binding domain-containing protein n=1 Tax=Microdochium trichocladiopsis TaxID=1682393 RepID=A0A9P9BV28_9PEZI|nr:uncharacterized protein B0I36DRAFT_3086 [Microdochium trichocladiopsis]KAH7039883.1 hypothetical protein B0I36DRAFT_3086 [Microdochium trichocladiopsis]
MSSPLRLAADGKSWKFESLQDGLQFLYGTQENFRCQVVNHRGRSCSESVSIRGIEQILSLVCLKGKVLNCNPASPSHHASATLKMVIDDHSTHDGFISGQPEKDFFDALVWYSMCTTHRNSEEYEIRKKTLRRKWQKQVLREISTLPSASQQSDSNNENHHRSHNTDEIAVRSPKPFIKGTSIRTPQRFRLPRQSAVALEKVRARYSPELPADHNTAGAFESDSEISAPNSPVFDSPPATSAETPLTSRKTLWQQSEQKFPDIFANAVEASAGAEDESNDEYFTAEENETQPSLVYNPRLRLFQNPQQRPSATGLDPFPSESVGLPRSSSPACLSGHEPVPPVPAPSGTLGEQNTTPNPLRRARTMPIKVTKQRSANFDTTTIIERRHSFDGFNGYEGFESHFDRDAIQAFLENFPATRRRRKSVDLALVANSRESETSSESKQDGSERDQCRSHEAAARISSPSSEVTGLEQAIIGVSLFEHSHSAKNQFAPTRRSRKVPRKSDAVMAKAVTTNTEASGERSFEPKKTPVKDLLELLSQTHWEFRRRTGGAFIYGYRCEGSPEYVKIGRTERSSAERLAEWKLCGESPVEIYSFATRGSGKFAEDLIKLELHLERRKRPCAKHKRNDGVTPVEHNEWFKIEEEEAIERLELWERFHKLHMYHRKIPTPYSRLSEWVGEQMEKIGEFEAWGGVATGVQAGKPTRTKIKDEETHRREMTKVLDSLGKFLDLEEAKRRQAR